MSTATVQEPHPQAEPLEQTIVRLADAIGSLHPNRTHRAHKIDQLKFELPRLPGMDCHTLTALLALPEAQEVITAKCNHCEALIECRRVVAPFVACDECIQKAKDDAALERNREYWERVCPERYRKTNTKHGWKDGVQVLPDAFPFPLWFSLKADYKANPEQSLFLYGPTGSCKTRIAMLVLKQALLAGNRVGILWPEKLRTLSSGFETTTFDHYAAYDVLLMDDCLLTACRESKLIDTLKQLLDVRMRHNRPSIVTSQIGTEQDLTEAKEYGDAKNADKERIAALLRRLREDCRVVPFAKVEPKAGEAAF